MRQRSNVFDRLDLQTSGFQGGLGVTAAEKALSIEAVVELDVNGRTGCHAGGADNEAEQNIFFQCLQHDPCEK